MAAAYAVACFGKYFDDRGIVLQTENEGVAAFAQKPVSYTHLDVYKRQVYLLATYAASEALLWLQCRLREERQKLFP